MRRLDQLLPWSRRFPRRHPARRFKPMRMEPRPNAYADWYCEAVAVGMERDAGVCSPGHQIHRYPCGWMS